MSNGNTKIKASKKIKSQTRPARSCSKSINKSPNVLEGNYKNTKTMSLDL